MATHVYRSTAESFRISNGQYCNGYYTTFMVLGDRGHLLSGLNRSYRVVYSVRKMCVLHVLASRNISSHDEPLATKQFTDGLPNPSQPQVTRSMLI